MCHIQPMMKITMKTLALSAAVSIGFIPSAAAQSDAAEAGIPYEITFNGSMYPADINTVEYPYIAASQERDGECLLNVISNEAGNVASISIISCSDNLFKSAVSRYINKQDFDQSSTTNLTAHSLRVNWDIGEKAEPLPLTFAQR